MTSEFAVYFRLGVEHILDPRGYDHILFVVALTVMYPPSAWRRVLILVTAFTVGHSLTLGAATLDRLRAPTDWIEFLIPITILVTSLLDMAEVRWSGRHDPVALEPRGGRRVKYALALVFGLIHGLGFSNFLRAALGSESSVVGPLFAFNVGLEAGQVVVVAAVLAVTGGMTRIPGVTRRRWVMAVSGATAAVSVYLAMGRVPL